MRAAKILELRVYIGMALLLSLLISNSANGQQNPSLKLLEFKYGFHLPAADMKDRFGANSDFGLGLIFTGAEKKLFWGGEAYFLFGSIVKEDVIASLRTYDGSIIGIDGRPADVNLKERGFYTGLLAGKIFLTDADKKSLTGIRFQLGAGLLQHKIRVQDNFNSVVALEKKHHKGYDRLSNGPALHLGLGFQYQNASNNIHFHVLGDMYAARTASRRSFDYPNGEYLSGKRTDILAGMSIAYIVTISRQRVSEHIYY